MKAKQAFNDLLRTYQLGAGDITRLKEVRRGKGLSYTDKEDIVHQLGKIYITNKTEIEDDYMHSTEERKPKKVEPEGLMLEKQIYNLLNLLTPDPRQDEDSRLLWGYFSYYTNLYAFLINSGVNVDLHLSRAFNQLYSINVNLEQLHGAERRRNLIVLTQSEYQELLAKGEEIPAGTAIWPDDKSAIKFREKEKKRILADKDRAEDFIGDPTRRSQAEDDYKYLFEELRILYELEATVDIISDMIQVPQIKRYTRQIRTAESFIDYLNRFTNFIISDIKRDYLGEEDMNAEEVKEGLSSIFLIIDPEDIKPTKEEIKKATEELKTFYSFDGYRVIDVLNILWRAGYEEKE